MTPVRVRFSPAPTGSLHVGSARTALFNWLFARHNDGTFVLRVEDTDVARSRAEWVEGIQGTLGWLGLDWDEGPVLQSTRFDVYLAAAERLVAEGLAYECYCTEDEVRARNEQARAEGRTPGYDGKCRDLDASHRAALAAEGRPRSLRFRTPDDGVSTFDDLVRGPVSVEWAHIPDFVIVRSGGTPLFFLANAVDDADMGITHVIRGEDLLDSTHRVLALRAALGVGEPPAYAHLPLIVGADRAKLSKRHGAVALEEFRAQGYLPEALMNYLALLGWAPSGEGDEGHGREVLDASELVAEFELERVTHAAAAFDHQKLDWMNGEWIRRLALDELGQRVLPIAAERFGDRLDEKLVHRAVGIGQERAVTLVSLVDQMDFLFVPEEHFEIGPEAWERLTKVDRVADVLDAAIAHIETCEWTTEAIDLRPALNDLDVKLRKVMPALYIAIEGRPAGLPLFDAIHMLGQDRALGRLRAARKRLAHS